MNFNILFVQFLPLSFLFLFVKLLRDHVMC